MKPTLNLLSSLLITAFSLHAADPVPLGKGSYAPEPPGANAALQEFMKGRDRLDPSLPPGTPVPSNDIFAFALWSNDKDQNAYGRTYLMPLAVSVGADGIGIANPNQRDHPLNGVKPLMISVIDPANPSAPVSIPVNSHKALRIGDWSMTYRFRVADDKYFDLTIARGMPIAWVEAKGLELQIASTTAKPLAGINGALIDSEGTSFAAYSGDNGKLVTDAAGVKLTGTGGASVLALAALPSGQDAAAWRPAALSIPRGTDFSWVYDREKGRIVTTWKIATEPLGKEAGEPIQGWLPHQWRNAMDTSVKFLPGEYLCPRGKIKLARGTQFTLSWPVTGVLPTMPAPDGKETPPFNKERMEQMLSTYVADNTGAKLKYGDDTYFGAKDVERYAQTAALAAQLDSPSRKALAEASRAVLTDWFTWTPGEKAHYWARYEKLGAFVGFAPSFNAQEFRDTHFHCGYFTYSAAIQCSFDPTFAADFGGVATLIAKQYANWDKKDTRFPFLRTFDPWAGHSYASAKGNAGGDSANQESSSEAMNAWAGVALLGAALHDDGMRDCGLMGYAIELEAIKEYWNDYYGWLAEQKNPGGRAEAGNWPPGYKNSIASIISEGGNGFATFFSGSPYHIYGIQWLPLSPALQYLSWDPAFAKFQWETMRALQASKPKTPGFDIEELNEKDLLNWSNVMIGYLIFADPDGISKRWEAMALENKPATQEKTAPITYYLMHAYQSAGLLDASAWADQPTASVMKKADGTRNIVAWNPGATPMTVTARDAHGVLGTATVPPGAMVRTAIK
jgi:endoglucanase Acf2